MRVGGIKKESLADGPGINNVLFLQGCLLKCPGCHNPELQPPEGGVEMDFEELIEELCTPHVDGVVFTGGEPLFQGKEAAKLMAKIRDKGYRIILFTGFYLEDLKKSDVDYIKSILYNTDIIIDGPYVEELKDPELSFRGSSNQRIIELGEDDV